MATEPLPIRQSWPLSEQRRHFDLGQILSCAVTDVVAPVDVMRVGFPHVGYWECDLADDSLIWSGGVYDIFGLPRGASVTREETIARYSEGSRAAMDRLRTYAIKHRHGFTLDAEISPASGQRRWMRLIAAPICDGNRVVRLHGLKLII